MIHLSSSRESMTDWFCKAFVTRNEEPPQFYVKQPAFTKMTVAFLIQQKSQKARAIIQVVGLYVPKNKKDHFEWRLLDIPWQF